METTRPGSILIAIGGNSIIRADEGATVGAALLRSERAAADTYPLPLDVCVASTQGEIGFLLQQALDEALAIQALSRPVATVLAQVVVAPNDPAFAQPTKPIGPFYSREEANARRRSGWTLVEERSHGYRRAVPSPEPLDIIEEPYGRRA